MVCQMSTALFPCLLLSLIFSLSAAIFLRSHILKQCFWISQEVSVEENDGIFQLKSISIWPCYFACSAAIHAKVLTSETCWLKNNLPAWCHCDQLVEQIKLPTISVPWLFCPTAWLYESPKGTDQLIINKLFSGLHFQPLLWPKDSTRLCWLY